MILRGCWPKPNETAYARTLSDVEIAAIRQAAGYYAEKVFEYPALDEAFVGYRRSPGNDLLASAASALVGGQPCMHPE
jgi:hypothetical protein